MAKKKTAQQPPKPLKPEEYIRKRVRQLPIYKCYKGTNNFENREMVIVVVRQHTQGSFTFGAYMLDRWCLGVKDSFFQFNIQDYELKDFIAEWQSRLDAFEEVDYVEAHNWVYGAMGFAEDAGIKPCKEFEVTQYILEEDNDDVELIEYEFGRDGEYCLVAKDRQEAARYIPTLDYVLGKGNYTVEVGPMREDYDEEDEDDYDDDYDFDDEDVPEKQSDDSTDKYERRQEILLGYLDANIDKLVKLKVVTRAEYNKLEKVYKDYIVADSLEDKYRTEYNKLLVEKSRLKMLEKLLKAIKKNPEIAKEPEVATLGLMLNDWEDKDLKYTDFYDNSIDKDNYRLRDAILYLSHDVDEDREEEMEDMPHETLLEMLRHRFYDCTEEWIDDLTYNDLTILRNLCDSEDGRIDNPLSPLTILLEEIDLVDFSDDEFILYPDIRNTVEPFLDKAIEKKRKNGEPFLEQLFLGILNICGILSDEAMSVMMKTFVRDSHKKLTDKDVDNFLRHTMLVRYYHMAYVCSPGNLMSHIVSPGWESDVRKEYDMYIPTSLDEVLSRGSYPYFQPYRKEETAFHDLLSKKIGKADADSFYTYYYCKLQDPECDLKELIEELNKDLKPKGIAETKECMDIFQKFNNNIPKIFLKGNASCDRPTLK